MLEDLNLRPHKRYYIYYKLHRLVVVLGLETTLVSAKTVKLIIINPAPTHSDGLGVLFLGGLLRLAVMEE